MKAKIRKTGEIVDIIYYYNNFNTIRSSQDFVSYIDSNGIEHDRESLNYYWDFESIDDTQDKDLQYWQDVRERAAIAAMQGVMNFFGSIDYNKETIAKLAIEQADELVKQLKDMN